MHTNFKLLKTAFLLPLVVSLFSSCGWHLAPGMKKGDQIAIQIPYVEGDHKGTLTSSLVSSLEKEGSFRVRDSAHLILKVRLTDSKHENIGFRHKPKSLGEPGVKIIPDETRIKLLAEISVVDATSGRIILGPKNIIASVEFDHQNYSIRQDINSSSLGQLSDIDTTYDVIDIPLHRNMAHQISTYLSNHWQEIKQ